MKKEKNCRYKGLALLEIIAILITLAILAAIMLPAFSGYIEKAGNKKYIDITREFVMAAQGGLVEAYALDQVSFDESLRTGKLPAANGNKYGYFTSYYGKKSYRGEKHDVDAAESANGDRFKKAVCNYLGDYLENKNIVMSDVSPEKGRKVSDFNGKCAFVIAFNDRAKVIYVQFVNEDKMVTFDGNSYVVSDDGVFVDIRNPQK